MNYRLYSFVNFYLSSIQQGVQTAHLVAEMFVNTLNTDKKKVLNQWAIDDKTIIILNGGSNTDIQSKSTKLKETCCSTFLPTGYFYEDAESLGGMMTCCGVVLPEIIWGAVDYRTAVSKGIIESWSDVADKDAFYYNDSNISTIYEPGSASHDLILMIKSCRLAS